MLPDLKIEIWYNNDLFIVISMIKQIFIFIFLIEYMKIQNESIRAK